MGIISDSMKARLDDLIRRDEESQRELEKLLAELADLAQSLKEMTFDD